jgi:hypothetical protein
MAVQFLGTTKARAASGMTGKRILGMNCPKSLSKKGIGATNTANATATAPSTSAHCRPEILVGRPS